MKILLCSIGTRGDIVPFLALGTLLRGQGHQVAYSFHAQFASLLQSEDAFYPLSPKLLALINSEDGKIVMGKASLRQKIPALWRLYRAGLKINRELCLEQLRLTTIEKPDAILHHPKCSFPFLWSLKEKRPSILISPVPYYLHYVENHAHLGFKNSRIPLFNRLSYSLARWGFAYQIHSLQNYLDPSFQFSFSRISKALRQKKIVFALSPALFPRPSDWPPQAQVFRLPPAQQAGQSRVSPALERFLTQHAKVVLLSFGSMQNRQAEEISRLFYQVLYELEIPSLINTAAGKLVALAEYQDHPLFYFVEELPYEQVLGSLYAIIHHGGAGTCQSALSHGLASLIIPHIIDQFAWNKIVYEQGCGPKGLALNALKKDRLKALISDLYQRESYKQKAVALASKMAQEGDDAGLYSFLLASMTAT